MEFQTPSFLYCSLCFDPFDLTFREPLIVPCGEGHTVCSACLNILIETSESFQCPMDKIEVYPKPKSCNEFARNLPLIQALKELAQHNPIQKKQKVLAPVIYEENCNKHPDRKPGLACLDCCVKSCSLCKLETHISHNVMPLEHYDEIDLRKHLSGVLQRYMNRIEEINYEYEFAILAKQESLFEKVDLKAQEYVEKVYSQANIIKEQIKDYFTKLREKLKFGTEPEMIVSLQIFNWNEQVKKKLFEEDRVNLDELREMHSTLISLDIDPWLKRKQEQDLLKLDEELNQIRVEFGKEFESSLESIYSFNPSKDEIFEEVDRVPENSIKTPVKEKIDIFEEVKQEEEKIQVVDKKAELQKSLKDLESWKETLNLPCSFKIGDNEKIKMIITIKKDQDTEKLKKGLVESKMRILKKFLDKMEINCKGITDRGIKLIAELISEFSELHNIKIDLESCSDINDYGIVLLSKELEKLSSLNQVKMNFAKCTNIGNNGLDAVALRFHKLNKLTHLSLSFARATKITDAGLFQLIDCVRTHPTLTHLSLDFSKCPNVSKHAQDNLNALLTQYQPISWVESITSFFGSQVKALTQH